MRFSEQQPRVKANDWSVLDPPPIGQWTPDRSVTVVIPAFEASATLPYTLASLVAQTYPEHLLEVVVVDDGSTPPLDLPEIRPERTRLVTTRESWGRAHACAVGAQSAEGEVIHWLDADMLLYRDEVEAQMRWHHLIDYAVVLGQKTFVDPDEGLPTVEDARRAVAAGEAEALFRDRWMRPHEWVETEYARSDDLRREGPRAFLVHVGATASVDRGLYRESGGMDSALKLGEDIELGYRLSQRGAVFVPDRQARSWHLGRTTVMRREHDVNRYNDPFWADRVPPLRRLRKSPGRTFAIPLIQAVIDTRGHTLEQVAGTVDGVLASSIPDVTCRLVGAWSGLSDDRRSVLDDAEGEARLVAATYASDGRVDLVEETAPSAFPAAFRLTLPVGWVPSPKTLGRLFREMEDGHRGVRLSLLPDGSVARLERTAARLRAERVLKSGEDLDDVMDEVYGLWWGEGLEDGFVSATDDPGR